jgi:hypothetical protein
MTNKDIFKDILSESEIETLITLQEKIQSKLSEKATENTESNLLENFDASSPYAFDEINKPNHLSNENRELIFYVRAEVSSIDYENHKYLSLDQCLDESFHIPIPSGTNLDNKINEFMNIIENSLNDLAKKIHKPQDGKNK